MLEYFSIIFLPIRRILDIKSLHCFSWFPHFYPLDSLYWNAVLVKCVTFTVRPQVCTILDRMLLYWVFLGNLLSVFGFSYTEWDHPFDTTHFSRITMYSMSGSVSHIPDHSKSVPCAWSVGASEVSGKSYTRSIFFKAFFTNSESLIL